MKKSKGGSSVPVNSTAGTEAFSYTLGNGSNFLTILATGGVGINSITLDPDVGFTDLRQVRISGVGGLSVPEGNTLSAVLGLGLCTAIPVLRKRRKK